MDSEIIAAAALLCKTARWFEARAEHPGSRFIRKALALRASAMTLLRGVHGYTLRRKQMELDYGS